MPKRPDKIKMRLTRPDNDMIFVETFCKASVYTTKLLEAANSGQVIEIAAEDSYVLTQFKQAAKKIQLRLLFAKKGESIYVKPIQPTEHEQRLIRLLREPRTVDELKAVSPRLELHLEDTLQRMARIGTAHIYRGKWVLTESGLDLLAQARSAAA